MANSSSILEMIPFLPLELQSAIRHQTLLARNRDMLAMCHLLLYATPEGIHCTKRLPSPEYPWHAPVWFDTPWQPWTPLFYVYMWYLFNTYHVPLVFDPKDFKQWGAKWEFDYTLFDKFWFQVFGEDWRVVASGQSLLHPLRRPLKRNVILIVKVNSSQGLPSNIEWVRNAGGDFHRHTGWFDEQYLTCQTTIWRAHFLNTGNTYNIDECVSTPEATHLTEIMDEQENSD